MGLFRECFSIFLWLERPTFGCVFSSKGWELSYKIEIYIENSGFWEGILAQIPGARRGFWKSPRARRAARRDFQNPRTGDGDLGKIPDHKPEFCTYFFSLVSHIQTILILLLSYLLRTFKEPTTSVIFHSKNCYIHNVLGQETLKKYLKLRILFEYIFKKLKYWFLKLPGDFKIP